MKKLLFGLIAIVMFGFTGNAQMKFVKMDLPASIQSKLGLSETIVKNVSFKARTGAQTTGQIRFVIPDAGSGLISLEFSENILSEGNIKIDFYVANSTALEGEPGTNGENLLTKCFNDCQARYTNPDGTKIAGRGWCKAGCWFDASIRALPLVLTLIK